MRITLTPTVRSVGLRFGARALGTVLQAAGLVALARALGPDGFGVYSVSLAAGYFVGAMLSFGGPTRLLRSAAEARPEAVASGLLVLRAISAGVAGLAAVAAGAGMLAVAAASLVVGDLMMEFEQARRSGRREHLSAAVLVILQRLLPTASSLLILLEGVEAIWALVVCGVGLAAVAVWRPITNFRRPESLLGLVKTSSGYWLASLAANLNQLETVVLRAIVSPTTLGGYAAASRIANPLTIFVAALQVVVVPDLAATANAGAERRLFRRFMTLALGYAGLLLVTSPVIVTVFLAMLGPSYQPWQMFLYAMVAASAMSAVSQACQSRLLAMGRPALASFLVIVGTACGLALLGILGQLDDRLLWIAPVAAQAVILGGMLWLALRVDKGKE